MLRVQRGIYINLAKLEISKDEIPLYMDRIQNILSIIDGIDALPYDADTVDKGADFNLLREDNIKPSFENSDILSNAKDCENGYFKLRKKA